MANVRMYTTTYCGYCRAAKRFLNSVKGVEVEEIDITSDWDTRQKLVSDTGQNTVPQIYVGEAWVGGYTDMIALDREGRLDAMLAA